MSNARVAIHGIEAHGENALSTEVDLLQTQVVDFLNKEGIEFTSSDINLSHARKTKKWKLTHDSCKSKDR